MNWHTALSLIYMSLFTVFNGRIAWCQGRPPVAVDEDKAAISERDYAQLSRAADTIVIARVESNRAGPTDLYLGDDLKESIRGDRPTLEVRVTRLRVMATLRGMTAGQTIELVHVTRRTDSPIVSFDNLSLAKIRKTMLIRTGSVALEIRGEQRGISEPTKTVRITPEYLLFLKVRDDGRYELASGDKRGEDSVRVLND